MENDLFLSLETATRGGSLALMRGEKMLASSIGIADESHSVNLLARIESILNEGGVRLQDIDLFAVASGPGSFTGLRIGLATMKAFSSVLDRPCIGVPTLEAIAFAADAFDCTYALLPAGRGEVFAQMFALGARASRPLGAPSGAIASNTEPQPTSPSISATSAAETPDLSAVHLPPHILLERLTEPASITWAGPGAHAHKELIRERAAALGVQFIDANGEQVGKKTVADIRWTLAPNILQLAKFVALRALQVAKHSNGHRAEDLHAIYVRPSDAEMNR